MAQIVARKQDAAEIYRFCNKDSSKLDVPVKTLWLERPKVDRRWSLFISPLNHGDVTLCSVKVNCLLSVPF